MGIERNNTVQAGPGGVRELDGRTSDGVDVRLLWEPRANRVTVAVTDMRADGSLEFEVEPADALAAFHHPYAYASHDYAAHALAA
jgi:hypothetical protein